MTAKKTGDQKPREINLTTGQAIVIERTQAAYRHLIERYAMPLKEVQDAETAINTALNAILSATQTEPSASGWHFIVDGDVAKLIEGEPE